MTDLERLNEALTDYENAVHKSEVVWDQKAIVAAARAYRDLLANGEETAWCPTHHSVYLNPDDGCEAVVGAQAKRREPCVETWVRVHPTTEEER